MIRHCSLLITPLADTIFNSFYYIFALKILTKMKIFFVSSLYAVCCILSICMPVNLVSSGVGLKGNWPTVQCTIQQYRLEKNGQLRMQYGPVFFQCPLVNVTRNVSFSLLPSRAVCLTSMHTGGNLLAILGTKSAYTCLLAPHPPRKKETQF